MSTEVSNGVGTTEPPSFAELGSLLAPALVAAPYRPVPVVVIEVAGGLRRLQFDVAARADIRHVLALCTLHGHPLGVVLFDCDVDDVRRVWIAEVEQQLGPSIARHLERDNASVVCDLWHGWDESAESPCNTGRRLALRLAPPVNIVVATRERPFALARCLESLMQLAYPAYDVLVVDNAPTTTATREVVEAYQRSSIAVRYVREDRRGLGNAHNAALREATGEIIAITDDDVVVDRHWLTELVVPFATKSHVAAATGLILPGELETGAQARLEAHGRYVKGYTPRLFDRGDHRPDDPRFPFTAGTMGAGANMAFRTDFLRRIGGFDPYLGAGTIARGGDDLRAFFEVIVTGATLAYRPGAIVWHHHRRDEESLERQVFDYGVGLGAYLTSAMLHHPKLLADLVRRLPAGVALLREREVDRAAARWPAELEGVARRGLLYGPIAYARSRWTAR